MSFHITIRAKCSLALTWRATLLTIRGISRSSDPVSHFFTKPGQPVSHKSIMPGPRTTNRQGRIPATLQSVFLASNRGNDVSKPPPDKSASKTFFRNFFFQRQAGSRENTQASTRTGSFLRFRGGRRKKSVVPPKSISVPTPVLPTKSTSTLSPQGYLDAMIRSRGYSTRRFKTLQSAYYCKPTPLQQASYDVYMIELVKNEETELLDEILACGVSPNPCNRYGESLVHAICRRGQAATIKVMLKHGCNLQVADDYGRTPLHDACWAARPCFDVVELLLERDVRLFHMTDCRGATPLSYVRKDHWPAWIAFLEAHKDTYWPMRQLSRDGEQAPPPLTKATRQPLPDPVDAVTCELATLLCSGKLTPEEAHCLKYDNDDDESESSDASSLFSQDVSDFSFDDEQFDELLQEVSIFAPPTPVAAH